MSDFALRRESIEEILDYSVLVTQFENDAEQRRLRQPNKVIGFTIKTPPLIKTQYAVYRAHFISKFGALNTFTFTSPFDDVEYHVRYQPQTFKSTFKDGCFTLQFDLHIVTTDAS